MSRADLVAAAGALRDGIAAIDNLGELLRSRRVGPRSLSGGLPDLQEGAAALAGRIDAFAAAAADELASEPAARAAFERTCAAASARASELHDAFTAADPRTARGRLALEASVQSLLGVLPELLALASFLVAKTTLRPVTLALADALSVRWREVDGAHEVHVRADATITGDPAVFGPLLEVALGALAQSPTAFDLELAEVAEGARLSLRRVAADGTGLRAPARPWSSDAVAAAVGAARAAGIVLEIGEGSAVVVLPGS